MFSGKKKLGSPDGVQKGVHIEGCAFCNNSLFSLDFQ